MVARGGEHPRRARRGGRVEVCLAVARGGVVPTAQGASSLGRDVGRSRRGARILAPASPARSSHVPARQPGVDSASSTPRPAGERPFRRLPARWRAAGSRLGGVSRVVDLVLGGRGIRSPPTAGDQVAQPNRSMAALRRRARAGAAMPPGQRDASQVSRSAAVRVPSNWDTRASSNSLFWVSRGL